MLIYVRLIEFPHDDLLFYELQQSEWEWTGTGHWSEKAVRSLLLDDRYNMPFSQNIVLKIHI